MKKVAILFICIIAVFSARAYLKENKKNSRKENLTEKEISKSFTHIYDNSLWQVNEDSPKSGYGSSPEFCQEYTDYLSNFVKTHKIKKVLDLGCGDWTFSKSVQWGDTEYIGIDVVQSVIDDNNKAYAASNRSFHRMELSEALDKFGKDVDLVICKDVLQHLPYDYVLKVSSGLSKVKHVLITNDIHENPNAFEHDMESPFRPGEWHLLDLSKSPFNLSVKENLQLFPAEPEYQKVKTTQYIQNI